MIALQQQEGRPRAMRGRFSTSPQFRLHCTYEPAILAHMYLAGDSLVITLQEPKFSVSALGTATGANVNTIRQWFKRDILQLGPNDAPPETEGMGRQFSGETALVIGIVNEILKRNLASAPAAAAAANRFVHSGDDKRLPGHLFPDGWTYLVILPDRDKIGSRIVNASDDTPIRKIMLEGAVAVIDLEEIVERVRLNLGLGRDPRVAPKRRAR